jgi:Trk K+ transport system NAD-binding subunit
VIVCGLNDVALRTVEQLHLAGARTVVLSDEADERLVRIVRGWEIPQLPRGGHLSQPLFDAGIAGASAVVVAESTDLRTLETVLQIRDLRPDVRVVADLDNPSVGHAVEGVLSSVGVLDVAALFAPAVVETCLARRAREIELGETSFVAAEVVAPRDGTLRELYGSLAPIGVVADADETVIACPGRDQLVSARDRVTLLGTRAELDAAGLVRHESSTGATAAAQARSFLKRQHSAIAGIERMENNPYLTEARALHAPIVLGDATLARTLDAVNLSQAAAVAILTSDDLTNIETGLAIRDHLGDRWADVPVVLRVFDRQLGHRLESSFGFRHVWSTSAIAAPWFVGAALGLDVLFTFYVGNHPFLLARLRVSAGGGLDGLAMRELPATVRVVAIRRAADSTALEHPPRRDTRLTPDDDAYLVGPYAELLEVLRHDREAGEATAPTTS